jgi:hypothetical protein
MLLAPTPFLLGRHRQWFNAFRARDVDAYISRVSGVWRSIIRPSNGFPYPGKQLRATFMPSPTSGGQFMATTVTMGIWDGVAGKANMKATPVQLTFDGGGVGFSDTGGQMKQSDPLFFGFAQTDALVFHFEGAYANVVGALFDAPNCQCYSQSGTGFYNKAAGSTSQTLFTPDIIGVYAVDVYQ